MDSIELARSLARDLWPDCGVVIVTCEDVFTRVSEMNRQRGEMSSILDAAGVESGVELPGRVARLVADRARFEQARLAALEGCNEAQKRWEAERATLAARVKKMNDEGVKVRDLLETYRHNKQNDTLNPLSFIVRRTLEDKDQQLTDLRKELALVRAERDGIAKERTNSLNGKFLDEIRRATGCLLFGDNLVAAIKDMKEKLTLAKLNTFAPPCVPGTCPLNTAPSSTAANPAKPGLQPMKCPCGGKIEFGRERVGYCQKCGASCRVMDPPPSVPSQPPEGHMIHIPAEYCGNSSLMHAYADGYLAGKGAK